MNKTVCMKDQEQAQQGVWTNVVSALLLRFLAFLITLMLSFLALLLTLQLRFWAANYRQSFWSLWTKRSAVHHSSWFSLLCTWAPVVFSQLSFHLHSQLLHYSPSPPNALLFCLSAYRPPAYLHFTFSYPPPPSSPGSPFLSYLRADTFSEVLTQSEDLRLKPDFNNSLLIYFYVSSAFSLKINTNAYAFKVHIYYKCKMYKMCNHFLIQLGIYGYVLWYFLNMF